MVKKFMDALFSTRLTGILFIVFAAAMAVGTFMDASESRPPSNYSRVLIYNAWWFEAIMGLFVVNFIGNIFRYRLLRIKKLGILGLHLSFILILIGAFITRYIGHEGVMSIREGDTENTYLSEKTYLTVRVVGDYEIDGQVQQKTVKQPLMLHEKLKNRFAIKSEYGGQPFRIEYVNFIEGAADGVVENPDGDEYLKIVEAEEGRRHSHWIKKGEVASLHGLLFAFDNEEKDAINIWEEDGTYRISSPFSGSYLWMDELGAAGIDPRQMMRPEDFDRLKEFQKPVHSDSVHTLQFRSRYALAGMAFVVPGTPVTGEFDLIKALDEEPSDMDGLVVKVSTGKESALVRLKGGQGYAPQPETVTLGGLEFHLMYGSELLELPFSIKLNDFIAERYPGTEEAYSSFMSKVTVVQPDDLDLEHDIYMNHILNHNGYRFFQASFHPDEGGTVLSVNHDFWGTSITYIGYTLLFICLIVVLLFKGSRFTKLRRELREIKLKKAGLAIVLLLGLSFGSLSAQEKEHDTVHTERARSGVDHNNMPRNATTHKGLGMTLKQIDSLILANAVSEEHAAKFARLVIQDEGGRMKPVHTFASELMRKVTHSDSYKGLNATQALLSMSEFPLLWIETPVIYLKRGNDSIRHVIGVAEKVHNVALKDLFDEQNNYKLAPYLVEASRKSNPNQFEKDFIKAHEKFHLLNQAMSGTILRVFPIPGDENNKWVSYPELQRVNLTGTDSLYSHRLMPAYFSELKNARKTGDYSRAEELLAGIGHFQKLHSSDIMPSRSKISAEVLHNKVDIFNRLYKLFLLIGVLMFVFIVIGIFKPGVMIWDKLTKVCKRIIWVLFALMTLGLAMRWYISGHAPWSDAYESVVYVAWATVLFGLVFGRRSMLTVASTAFVASIVLWVAHQNWMDPAITNLVPVLDSYWLMVHVSIIVGSYGPFTLGMILGVVALFLIVFTTQKNLPTMKLNVREISNITEMALTVGLVMLTIGNFLGGMWANESWGRYWGWDPKETWALISIMIYAFVIHARLIPGMRNRWVFNTLAVLAYASIMMTYFGVNFYLTGLHSYASGDKAITPSFVYYTLGFVLALSAAAYFKYLKLYADNGNNH